MKKYAKIINENTKECAVGVGSNFSYYAQKGMTEIDVEQAYDGRWYINGYAPSQPAAEAAMAEIEELKRKLSETDYAVIKIAEGAAQPDEYSEVIGQRAIWRARINELEAELGGES